ncbi:3'-5' exonuclease domain-containing protein 2 [Massilia forsythiae]|uniref:3'-5' exonuclease domain-containing protein 2 n=1 Tax=Massilia forsythiae TaxID=2728020 RepID=A0A7Z2W1F4_9BURK|nr:3'-5' exonuclease [Massilia forsythiae]QJE02969.1 3'-5' exonuclease domain-containing protein 2 [Massilia forsythiae]
MSAGARQAPAQARAPAPDDALPPYEGIDLADVRLVRSGDDAAAALAALLEADAIGFDTESKPTFRKGEVSTGPHLVQLATDRHAYLFQIANVALAAGEPAAGIAVLRAVLESPAILKVGFGLGDDLRRLRAKLGIDARNVLDLANALRRGERNAWGAKTAVARFFGRRLQKSRKITTTNWSLPRLSDKQIQYAADDAHVALRVYRHWRALPPDALPATAPDKAPGAGAGRARRKPDPLPD